MVLILKNTLENTKCFFKKNSGLKQIHTKNMDIKKLPIIFVNAKKKELLDYHISLMMSLLTWSNKKTLNEQKIVAFGIRSFNNGPEFSLTKASLNTLLYLFRINPQKYQFLFPEIQIERIKGCENFSNTLCELLTMKNFAQLTKISSVNYIFDELNQDLKKIWTGQKNPDFLLINESFKVYADVKNFNIGKTNSNSIIHLSVFIKDNTLICKNYLNNFTLKSLFNTTHAQFTYLTKNIANFNLNDQVLIKKGSFLLEKVQKEFTIENYINLQNVIFQLQPNLYNNYNIILHHMIISFRVIEEPKPIETISHNFKDINFTKTKIQHLNDFCIFEYKKNAMELNKAFITENNDFLLNISQEHIIKKPSKTEFWKMISESEGMKILEEKIKNSL